MKFFRIPKSRVRIKITRAGFIFIGVTIFMGVGAVNTGNNLLYLLVSGMLSFMAISGFLAMVNLRRLSIEIEPPGEIFADTKTPFRIKVKNQKRLIPSLLIEVKKGEEGCFLSIIPSKGEGYADLWYSFTKRGVYPVEGLSLCSNYPLGFFVRCESIPLKTKVTVFPKPLQVSMPLTPTVKGRKYGGDTPDWRKGYEGEFHGFRQYTPGDPIRLIYWKGVSKGTTLTKEYSAETSPPMILTLEMSPANTLEEKLGHLTYIIIELLKKGMAVGLLLKDLSIPPATGEEHRRNLLKILALY